MRILVASDSFKGTLSSMEAGRILKEELSPGHDVDFLPVSDGGEGFLDAFKDHFPGRVRTITGRDPLGREIDCPYFLSDGGIALVESAVACGLGLLADSERNPMDASSYGLGVLIGDALDLGAVKVYIGLGGSATNDGGVGMLKALGMRLFDINGNELREDGGKILGSIDSMDLSDFQRRVGSVTTIAVCDVDNPLVGLNGATRVYGPQKGADVAGVDQLERGMIHYAAVVRRLTGTDYADVPGAGAAGGLGFCLGSFFGAGIQQGIEALIELSGLEEKVKGYDLIITGEGKLDRQTGSGKVPQGMLRLGQRHRVPVVCLCGVDESGGAYDFERVFPIVPGHGTIEESIADSELRLRRLIREELVPWLG